MGRPYQILLPLFSLFLVRVDLTDLKPIAIKADILKVYDGDTVLIRAGAFQAKVRISKIDAPEIKQFFLNNRRDAGEMSRSCLRKILKKSGMVSIEGIDIYGRILGDIDRVSLELIKRGCVSLYPHARFESLQEKYLFLRESQVAKKEKRGLWAFGGYMQPKAWRKKFKKRI